MSKFSELDRARAERNLNPHREARLAMVIWGDEYAAQNGGSMDFWDTLSPGRKRQCRELADLLEKAPREKSAAERRTP